MVWSSKMGSPNFGVRYMLPLHPFLALTGGTGAVYPRSATCQAR